MRWRGIIGWLASVIAAAMMVGSSFVGGGEATAAPAARTAPAQAAFSFTGKVTLQETSIDGPALASWGTTSVLGWTGTDGAGHVNVAISYDGLHFGNKRVLNETSPFRPAVTLLNQDGPFSVAWTGTDPNHSLNVLYDVYGASPLKLTLLHESSLGAPGFSHDQRGPNGDVLLLAWTGTDPNHSLNILPITVQGTTFTPGTKKVLSQFSSNVGPQLAPGGWRPEGGSNGVALCWTSRALQPMSAGPRNPELDFGSATTLPEASAFTPSMSILSIIQGPPVWMSWTGTDAAHHLNLRLTVPFPSLVTQKTILGETALGGPALALFGAAAATTSPSEELAWTGTDPAHHLNIATFGISPAP